MDESDQGALIWANPCADLVLFLEVLKNHHNQCRKNKDLNPYLAIPHVRDMLIKPSDRYGRDFIDSGICYRLSVGVVNMY